MLLCMHLCICEYNVCILACVCIYVHDCMYTCACVCI